MRHRSPLIGLAFLLTFLLVPTGAADAGLIVAGTTYLPGTAIMDLTLLANTPFNPTNSAIVLTGVSGVGSITLIRDAEVGTTIAIPSLSGGLFFGSNAALGTYVFGNIPPLTGADFSGSITNVVQNQNDPGFATGQPSSFQSGNFSFGGASFGFEFLTGPAAGVTLFTDPAVPFQFSSVFNGLPPSSGTVLANSGPDVLNVLFGSTVVATTSNRIILLSSVPEPSSITLLGIFGALAIGGRGLVHAWHRRAGA
jgi:PEP-CTERM motif